MIQTFKTLAPDRTGSRKSAKTALIVCSVVLALAGCKHDDTQGKVAGWALVDPEQRHPIIVSQQPEVMTLHVSKGTGGLSPQQRAQVLGFADSSRASDAGNSRLVISAPSGTPNEVAAMNAVGEIRTLLSDRGFAESSIQVEVYHHDGGGDAPVKVSYLRYVAEGPQCGHWSENLANNPNNLPHPNLGCANQRNLAAMVINPADLLGPRTMGDRSSDRRDTVFGKYIGGEVSATQKVDDEKIDTKKSE
jgi:pilus assembly protein CpaD